VFVPKGDAEVGSDPEVADARILEFERAASEAGFEVWRVPELQRLVLDLLQVDDRVSGHGPDLPPPGQQW
jgi:hypothetical protein